MPKNKYDFIAELLEQKKITPIQKERILKLSVNELKSETYIDESLIKRIERIEKKLYLNMDKPEGFIPIHPKSDLPKYIDPSDLSKFLTAYNQHPVLKYTCHTIDHSEVIDSINSQCNRSDYSLIDHQDLIKNSFDELVREFNISPKIKTLILVYLTGKTFDGKYANWSSENIKVNWKSPELIKWAEMYPGLVPNPGGKTKNKGFKLPYTIKTKLTDKRINYFQDLVIHFKNLFHLKDDNSLREIIETANKLKLWSDKVNFEITDELFKKNLELFTDVDKLIQAYNKIIEMIIVASEKKKMLGKPNVKLTFSEVKGEITFTIHHKNSEYQKSILNTINRIGVTQTSLIKNQINGLCDLYLQADFSEHEYAKINLWDGKERQSEILGFFEGVEFILKFRK